MSWLRGILLTLLSAGAVLFALGLADFARTIERLQPPTPLPEADAIVSLTGGTRQRLTEGMQLLAEGRGRRLLVSGVDPAASDAAVFALLEGNEELIACCVDLGRRARDTLGNASETAGWARRNGFSRIFVVTDDYHMPRSLAELRTAMPNAQLIAYPVPTRFAKAGAWRRSSAALASLAGEYTKYLIIRARVAMLRADPSPTPAPQA